jgi:hypothetical protein
MEQESKATAYRVHAPLVALTNENDGRTRFVAIPRGTLILVFGKLGSIGLVDVECEGERLSVFSRDIEQRTYEIEGSNEIAHAQRHGP